MDLSVFFLSTPTGLGDFSSIDLVSSSSYPSGLGTGYSGIWFFLLTFLLVGKRFFHLFHETNTKQRWCITRSTKLAPRRDAIVMSWSRDLITWSHLSSSNNILLSPHPLTTYFPMNQTSFIYYERHINLAARLAIAEHQSYDGCDTI